MTTVPPSPRVLVADDDPGMRAMLAATLVRNGYEVLLARNGLEALQIMAHAVSIDGGPGIDLVLSDLRMPRLDGLGLLDGARAMPWGPPVICMTAFGDAATHFEAERRGAVALFNKPFDLDDMLAMVRLVLGAAPDGT